MGRLQDKIAVIVGGTSGIGLATARRFVEAGAHVFVMARRETELADAASEMDGRLTTVRGDVARLLDLDRLYADVAAKTGSTSSSPARPSSRRPRSTRRARSIFSARSTSTFEVPPSRSRKRSR